MEAIRSVIRFLDGEPVEVETISQRLPTAFRLEELQRVQDVLSSLSEVDLASVAIGEGRETSAIYRKLSLPIRDQLLVEDVLNFVFNALYEV